MFKAHPIQQDAQGGTHIISDPLWKNSLPFHWHLGEYWISSQWGLEETILLLLRLKNILCYSYEKHSSDVTENPSYIL